MDSAKHSFLTAERGKLAKRSKTKTRKTNSKLNFVNKLVLFKFVLCASLLVCDEVWNELNRMIKDFSLVAKTGAKT